MTVLVTGASGYVGRAIASRLVAAKHDVRGLVRETSAPLPDGVARVTGDLTDRDSVAAAVDGVQAIVHAAAHLGGGGRAVHARVTVAGTAGVLDAAVRARVQRFVHISTVAVHGWQPPGSVVTPEDALEPCPERRDDYAWAKIEAERWVLLYRDQRGLPALILRPGIVYGRGRDVLGRVVRALPGGVLVVGGFADMVLPLVHVSDVAEAAARALEVGQLPDTPLAIVGPEQPTHAAYLAARATFRGERRRTIYLDLTPVRAIGRRAAVRPATTGSRAYALGWTAQAVRYDVGATAAALGWTPRIGLAEGLSADPSPTGRDAAASAAATGH